jgi:hypothetical protein
MIPIADIQPEVPSPLPTCRMPSSDEITEDGFGYFRGTWFIGHVPVIEAQVAVREEGGIMDWLDEVATNPDEFERLASAIEIQDEAALTEPLLTRALTHGLGQLVTTNEEDPPLGDLEVGVAGLVHALSTIRCLTAASCRSHMTDQSWSPCPVVLFAAPPWRVELLAQLIIAEGCGLGLDLDRDLLTVYGASIRDTHRLAERIVVERKRFRRMPDKWRSRSHMLQLPPHRQLDIFSE